MPNMTRPYGAKPPKREQPAEAPDRVTNSLVRVGPEPVRIGSASSRSQITVHNPGSEPIYLGGRSCSPSLGLPVQPGGYASLDIDETIVLYGVTSTPEEVEVRVLEIG